MLLDKWTMIYEGYGKLSCTSPCSMYGVLLEHGLIDDPFWGLSEDKSCFLGKEDPHIRTGAPILRWGAPV